MNFQIEMQQSISKNSNFTAFGQRKHLVSSSNELIFKTLKHPFGMQLQNRHESVGDSYRYNFQNQEVDPEVKGEGNSVNYKYRMHDPRLGRFFAVDPLADKFPNYSPYSFSGNRVVDCIELEGAEEYHYTLTLKDDKPVITNWRREENWQLKDIFQNYYVSYISHIEFNGHNYTFKGRWDDATKIVDEFKADPNNEKWNTALYRDDLNTKAQEEINAVAAEIVSGPLGWVKFGIRKSSTTSPKSGSNLILGKYKKGFVKESEAIRDDLGIPKSWIVKPSKKDKGIKFIDPENGNNHIRVMPGRKDSKFKNSQNPYTIRYKEGSPVDSNGNKISNPTGSEQNKSNELHVPLENFKF